jgi:hypothetical protein
MCVAAQPFCKLTEHGAGGAQSFCRMTDVGSRLTGEARRREVARSSADRGRVTRSHAWDCVGRVGWTVGSR